MRLVGATLKRMMVPRPNPLTQIEQHSCAGKGYDSPRVRRLIDFWGYTASIKSRGQEQDEKKRIPHYRARRWVVERTHSWLNRFRRLLIRWEKKTDDYVAMLHFACAWITFRAAGVLG